MRRYAAQLNLILRMRLLTSFCLALAAIFASAQNLDADTNNAQMDCLFQEMHDATTWGLPATNGVQLGVAIFNGKGAKQFRVFTYLYDETNFWIGQYAPSGHRLSMSLKESGGKEVEKTKVGESITKPVGLLGRIQMKMRTSRTQNRFNLLAKKQPERYENPFNLLDCFNVEKPGINTLTIDSTLYKMSNHGDIYPIALPLVALQVPISQANIDNYRASIKNTR